jgi:hypothetical protein
LDRLPPPVSFDSGWDGRQSRTGRWRSKEPDAPEGDDAVVVVVGEARPPTYDYLSHRAICQHEEKDIDDKAATSVQFGVR